MNAGHGAPAPHAARVTVNVRFCAPGPAEQLLEHAPQALHDPAQATSTTHARASVVLTQSVLLLSQEDAVSATSAAVTVKLRVCVPVSQLLQGLQLLHAPAQLPSWAWLQGRAVRSRNQHTRSAGIVDGLDESPRDSPGRSMSPRCATVVTWPEAKAGGEKPRPTTAARAAAAAVSLEPPPRLRSTAFRAAGKGRCLSRPGVRDRGDRSRPPPRPPTGLAPGPSCTPPKRRLVLLLGDRSRVFELDGVCARDPTRGALRGT